MASIDVSDILCDPDFCDPFTFIRRVEGVDLTGRSQYFERPGQGYGSIQPLSGQTLRMMPALANNDGSIEIWTTTPLQTLTDKLKPDLIVWQGSRYIITAVPGNWSNFGAGFNRYVGTLHDVADKGTDGQQ